MRKKKEKSIFQQEVERDITTFRRLHGKKRLQFIYDYYKWYIIAAIAIILIIVTFANLLYEGQRDYRLRVCVVLNTDSDCTSWFQDFETELQKDGDKTPISIDTDRSFDYDDMYYYVQEIEIQTLVSSERMDVAICCPDMYDYLLTMNVCYPLDEILPENEFQELKEKEMVQYDTANLRENDDGSVDDSNAVDGYFALDISDTEFGKEYNSSEDTDTPLYAIIISNTKNLEEGIQLLQTIYNE